MDSTRTTNTLYTYGYLFTLLMGSLHFGYNIGIFGTYEDMFMKMYKMEESEWAWWQSVLTTLMPAGAMVTALISSKVMACGKRKTLYIAGLLTLIATVFMSVIQNPKGDLGRSMIFFAIGRVFIGFALGFYSSVCPAYISEISPKHLTGMFGSCHQVFVNIAILITAFIGRTLPVDITTEEARDSISWRLGYGGPFAFTFFQMILLTFVYRYESPSFYTFNDNESMAKQALGKIYPLDEEVNQVYEEIAEGKRSMAGDTNSGSMYATYKRAFWVGVTLPAIQQLTGINAIMFYAPTIFKQQSAELAKTLTLITMIVNLCFTFISVLISDKLGRRMLLILGSIGCGLGLLLAAIGCSHMKKSETGMDVFGWMLDCGIFFFVASFGVSHGPICWLYMAEVLPTQWMGYGVASSWVFTIIVALSVPNLLSSINYWTYEIFFVFMALSTIYSMVYVKETKGLTKQEIMTMYESKSSEALTD